MTDVEQFFKARDFLLNVKSYNEAIKGFKWPTISKFNWAIDYFDKIAEDNDNLALIYANENGDERKITFNEMRERSNQVANFLRDLGLQKGDRVFMIMDASVEIYEIILGVMKAGGAIIPGAALLSPNDIADRIERGNVKFFIAHSKYAEKALKNVGDELKHLKGLIYVGDEIKEELLNDNVYNYTEVDKYNKDYKAPFITFSNDELFLFFTSGTTSKPKLVMHNHIYPVGHLTTMYWIALQKGDVHLNISAPGWAKYAWSSFFAPWNAEATILCLYYSQFDAKFVLKMIEKYKVTTLCAPFSVLKLFTIENLNNYNFNLREIVSAGEPLAPAVVKKIEDAVNVTIREGYGQTETTLLIANFKGEKRVLGSLGKPAPGYEVKLLDDTLEEVKQGEDGEICVKTYPYRPLGLLDKYDDEEKNKEMFRGCWYKTSDSAYQDKEGYFYFVGRTDDVFKSLDYRISPFEVESEIAVHPSVLEVAVTPTVDERDRIVPKAFIVLKPDYQPTKEMALDLFRFIRNNMAPYKRPRSIEFMEEFPKTVSAKVMRKDLRAYDRELKEKKERGKYEFFESDFKEELNLGVRK